MGFADLSIAEIAADYSLPVEEVLHLSDQLGIVYKTCNTVWHWRMQRQLFAKFCLKKHLSGTSGSQAGAEIT
jgi:hypothetical protein